MKPLKVSELNRYIKKMFSSDIILPNIEVEGEVSNFKRHISGHLYFSLKDGDSLIDCVMFRRDALSKGADLAEGQKVVAKGEVSIYDKTSKYQLYVKEIKDDGVGDLYKAFEKLKVKLEKEGLFKEKYKKDLPFLPKNIGVVTSSTGAAVHDIINIIRRRFPSCKITIYPSGVQGVSAHKGIIKALNYLDKDPSIDVIIAGRGGGSIEDLFCFNNEDLARTIFNLDTPIISAVGHETDTTIADFVADLRAPTPSAAAELVVANIEELQAELDSQYAKLEASFKRKLKDQRNRIDLFQSKLEYNNPYLKLRNDRQDIDMLFKDLLSTIDKDINKKRTSLLSLENELKLLNPLLSLEKGYGILVGKDGNLIRNSEDIKKDDLIGIKLKDAELKVLVKEIKKENNLYGEE